MNGIYYGLSILGIFWLIVWFVQNDGRPGTAGLFGTRAPAEQEVQQPSDRETDHLPGP